MCDLLKHLENVFFSFPVLAQSRSTNAFQWLRGYEACRTGWDRFTKPGVQGGMAGSSQSTALPGMECGLRLAWHAVCIVSPCYSPPLIFHVSFYSFSCLYFHTLRLPTPPLLSPPLLSPLLSSLPIFLPSPLQTRGHGVTSSH